MKILYLSSVTSDKLFSDLFNKGLTIGYVGQKYHGMFVKGLECHLEDGDLTVLSQPPTASRSTIFTEKQNKISFIYVPIIPVLAIKQFIAICFSFIYAFGWCLKNVGQKKIVVCSIMRIYQFVPILLVAYLFRCRKVTIACDVPWITMTQIKLAKPSRKQRFVISISKKLCSIFDAYVFLTESMNELLNPKGKPYIVVEGFCDINMANRPNRLEDKYDRDVILYAGGLNVKYGIGTLVEAAKRMKDQGVELWLYGLGDLAKTLDTDGNIKYFGPRSNDEVVAAEMKATLLVNPRPTEGEYTRYSFPSKTLEYMASGTYMLTTRLAGIPDEYFGYCGVIDNETPEGIEKAITDAFSLGREELHRRGLAAKDFVLNNKNNMIQTKRVFDLFQSL